MWQGKKCIINHHVLDILCEFRGHNFVSGLNTLKPKKTFKQIKKLKKTLKNLFKKLFPINPRFFQPWLSGLSSLYKCDI